MGSINVLSFAVANLIAAGEVVDRPASVIKELIENAIDAHADRITVEIQNGGVTFMRVSDNGVGMTAEDLPVSIRRHATSKIKDAEDLDGILTLGFRGEALAAIASVSDLRIVSKTADAQFGSALIAHGGNIISVSEQGCSTGTTVVVENLFANVPARRKFLKKDITEAMAVSANVEKLALSHPNIAIRLIIDGVVKLETAGDGNLKNTIYAVFGKEFASKLIEVNSDNDGIEVKGFIGRTDYYKANRNHQNFFINGRYIKSKTATAAIEQAYTSYMPPEKFPCCVLYLQINPARVDVNVHPAKLEVKFSNEKAVFEAVYYTVRTALESNITRPSMQLNIGRREHKNPFVPKISEANVPVSEKKREGLAQQQLSYDLEQRTQPQPQMRMSAEEYRKQFVELPKKAAPPTVLPEEASPITHRGNVPVVTSSAQEMEKADVAAALQSRPIPSKTAQTATTLPKAEHTLPKQHLKAEEQPSAPPQQTEKALPFYRIIGTAFQSYVLVETEDKLLVIDQHAAHERIIFERLKAGMHQASVTSQMLMFPIDVMMTEGEVEALKEYGGELEQIGFSVHFARNTVSVNAIPDGVDSNAVPDMLETMADRILNATGSVKLTRDIIFEKALYQAACKAAIKAGREYAQGHIDWIVAKLMEIPDITFCPHGRPVALELSHHTLDKQFDRTGF